jgi:hypothetical protein
MPHALQHIAYITAFPPPQRNTEEGSTCGNEMTVGVSYVKGTHFYNRSRCQRGLRRRSWPLGYWDRGFQSRWRHGCLSLCFCDALFCVCRALCDGLITRPKESYQVSK